jgi:carbon storage regulator
MLSRKISEKIVITLPDGKLVTITVTDIEHGKCKLGFEAPKEVPIFRSELIE